ncbi:unnamed protein product [Chrysodeixis includens]|uniref:Uncharacterized protein n=1 Tax=Chrysodeixis includens TaxID=689277 RepID=A0A9P0FUY9_CHRIL|nr:unnamed protein product [Chrysodeixis includens]
MYENKQKSTISQSTRDHDPPLPPEEETPQPEVTTDSIEHKLEMMEKGEEEQKSVEVKKEEEIEVGLPSWTDDLSIKDPAVVKPANPLSGTHPRNMLTSNTTSKSEVNGGESDNH